jgi:hypothetical protein
MNWFDFFIKKKKVSLYQCQRILGRGAYGITYLTPDNLVVKIEAITDSDNLIGDEFGKDVVPTLPIDVRPHFTQIYVIQYLDYNPLPYLDCIEKDTLSYKLKNAKKYKVTIMEYSGVPIQSLDLSDESRREGFKQLFKPAFYALMLGYYHNDLHIGNITYDENKKLFKIIDYNSMTKDNGNFYPSWIILFDNFILNYFHFTNIYNVTINIDDIKFSGPSKFLKYSNLVSIYEIQFYPEKYKYRFTDEDKEPLNVFNPKDIMEALFFIESYNFTNKKYDKKKTLKEYYRECNKDAYIDIYTKVCEILKI